MVKIYFEKDLVEKAFRSLADSDETGLLFRIHVGQRSDGAPKNCSLSAGTLSGFSRNGVRIALEHRPEGLRYCIAP